MQVTYALPIVPGQTTRVREQSKEYEAHDKRYQELNKAAVVSRHSVWVQETPMGDFEITLLELPDPTKLRLTFEEDEYDGWWRALVKDTHGFDPKDASADFKPPRQVLSTVRGSAGPDRSMAFVVPVLAGKSSDFEKLAGELSGDRADEHKAMIGRLGIEGENWFLQQSPLGDAGIVYFEGPDLEKSIESFVKAAGPYESWFKGRLLDVTGIDWTQPAPPPPDLVFDWRS